MGIPLLTSREIVVVENSVEHGKRDKLTGVVRKVAIVDTALATIQVTYAQFRLLRPDHPLRRDVFTQFMDQSFIFPVMLFALITLHGILAVRLFFATKLVKEEDQWAEAVRRCRWWVRVSIFFVITSLLDLYVIVFLLAFDAYRRFITIAILTFVRIFDIVFRIFGIYFVGKLQYVLENPWKILRPVSKVKQSDDFRNQCLNLELVTRFTELQMINCDAEDKLLQYSLIPGQKNMTVANDV